MVGDSETPRVIDFTEQVFRASVTSEGMGDDL